VIDNVVPVDENVSESDNPTEFRYLFSCVWINLADAIKRLADYLKLTLHCSFQQFVLREGFPRATFTGANDHIAAHHFGGWNLLLALGRKASGG